MQPNHWWKLHWQNSNLFRYCTCTVACFIPMCIFYPVAINNTENEWTHSLGFDSLPLTRLWLPLAPRTSKTNMTSPYLSIIFSLEKIPWKLILIRVTIFKWTYTVQTIHRHFDNIQYLAYVKHVRFILAKF